jgi:hypothetical protein
MGMSKAEAGRLGGLATAGKHGRAHMSKIGKAGFRRLCTRFPLNSRRKALAFLHKRGGIVARWLPRPYDKAAEAAATAEVCRMVGLVDDDGIPAF